MYASNLFIHVRPGDFSQEVLYLEQPFGNKRYSEKIDGMCENAGIGSDFLMTTYLWCENVYNITIPINMGNVT